MSWQRCPVCDGTGQVPYPMSVTGTKACPTCRGKRIIHSVSGRPPEESTLSVPTSQEIPDKLTGSSS